jgi:hypothetical protein
MLASSPAEPTAARSAREDGGDDGFEQLGGEVEEGPDAKRPRTN